MKTKCPHCNIEIVIHIGLLPPERKPVNLMKGVIYLAGLALVLMFVFGMLAG